MVHAVLDTHAPGVTTIDVTHSIPPHDVRAGALTLWRAAPWLAPAVILAVVDPGVGTQRRAVALDVPAAGTVLVGPDNGLLLPAALLLGRITTAVELPPAPDAPGATFHGRDIFAPAAGRVAAGTPVEELGRLIETASLLGEPVPEPVRLDDRPRAEAPGVEAEVLWVDRFGNAQLNATADPRAPDRWEATTRAEGAHAVRIVSSYGEIAPDQVALVIDSYGRLSVCCDRASAASRLGLHAGDIVRLRPHPQTGP